MKRPQQKDFEAGLLRPMQNRSNPPEEYRKALENYADYLEKKVEELEKLFMLVNNATKEELEEALNQ